MSASPRRPLVIVVSHSHWDREWYLPFETFRHRLTSMVAYLLDILDGDEGYRHFMLDGQTVLLEDIAEVRPDLADNLAAHVASGRISIGPWYVLQDEFLVGGESLARNLLIGRRVAREIGRPMDVGYIPDAFGHVSQIPRILQGFGIDGAVLWRGVGDQADRTEWTWRAPGGAEVLCLWLRWDYSTARELSADVDVTGARLGRDLDSMAPLSRAAMLIWMNGTDHQWPQPHLPELLAALRRQFGDEVELRHTGLEEALLTAQTRLEGVDLPTITGELRRPGPSVGFLLPGVLSARSWQQRDHDAAEWRLTREAEPFVTLAGLDRRGPLDHAWRNLLKCQPHDTICGCSSDPVHREIAVRQEVVHQQASALWDEAVRSLGEEAQAWPALMARDEPHRALLVANPHPFATTTMVRTTVTVDRAALPVRLMGPQGEVAYDAVSDTPADPTLPRDHPDAGRTRHLGLEILANDLPAHGVRALHIESGAPSVAPSSLSTDGTSVENGLVQLSPVPGGISVTDLRSGATICHTFEDQADAGDEYNFCPLRGEEPRLSTEADLSAQTRLGSASASLRVRGTWPLPSRLNPDRDAREGQSPLGVSLTATLLPGVAGVLFDLELDNRSEDHRLRARFDLCETPATLLTDGPFDWIPRPAGEPSPAPDSVELPVATHPMTSLACVDLEAIRLGVGTAGLREVELSDDGSLYVTVLRCVGWLSRADLWNRPREAGPPVATPEAQGLGAQGFSYALAFDDLDERPSALHRVLEPMLRPPTAVPIMKAAITERALLGLEPAAIRLAGIKRAEEGDRVLIRLVGADSGPPTRTTLTLHRFVDEAWLSDLDERTGTSLPVTHHGDHSLVTVDVPARDVVTVAFRGAR